MKQSHHKKQDSGTSEKQEPKPPFGGYGISWFYMMFFIFLLLLTLFSNPVTGSREITWSFLQDSLLVSRDVEKIIVINKEVAEIYIKKERLSNPKYTEVR